MNKEYRPRLNEDEMNLILRHRNSDQETPTLIAGRLPKILVFDVETAPLEAFIWQLKNDYISPTLLTRANWFMLSWSAKWLFDPEIINDVVTPEEAIKEDDSRILASIWELIDEADIVISHNGKQFDHKILNMRWLMNQMLPPSPYKVIDTLQIARSTFKFPSYTLNYLLERLGLGTKLKHEGMGMWKKCIVGDEEALKNMSLYNDRDVFALEDLYLILRPWIKSHPNIGVFVESEKPVCRTCGSHHVSDMPGQVYTTNVSQYDLLRCDECGSISRKRQNKLPLKVRKALLTSV